MNALVPQLVNGYLYAQGSIVVVRSVLPDGTIKYEIADGNHRIAAIIKLGWNTLKVVVFTAPPGIIV